jgi:hypothetical protein
VPIDCSAGVEGGGGTTRDRTPGRNYRERQNKVLQLDEIQREWRSRTLFMYRRPILCTFRIAVDFYIVLYEGLYECGGRESPPPAHHPSPPPHNIQYRIQNTEYRIQYPYTEYRIQKLIVAGFRKKKL